MSQQACKYSSLIKPKSFLEESTFLLYIFEMETFYKFQEVTLIRRRTKRGQDYLKTKTKENSSLIYCWDFPGGLDGKVSAYNVGNPGSIPESGRSPGEGNGNPLRYSCLENPMDEGAWWAIVHEIAKSQTQLSNFTLHLRTFYT